MITNKNYIKLFALLIPLLVSSCIEYYKVTTSINSDGSLTRTVMVVGDSASIFEGKLKVPKDSLLWDISTRWVHKIKGDSASEKKYEYTATRTFRNTEELNEFLKPHPDSLHLIKTQATYNKKFRWFYTYLYFGETYFKSMPFNHYEINNFLSDDEYSFIWDDEFTYSPEHDSLVHYRNLEQMPKLSKADSLRGEELENEILNRFSEWYLKNIYEEYYSITLNELSGKYTVKHKLLKENKEILFKQINTMNYFLAETDERDDPINVISEFIGMNADSIKLLNPDIYNNFYTNLQVAEDFMDNHTIKNYIDIPGKLIKTNADSISASSAYWNYNNMRNCAKDYTLFAESRIINKWAFILSGLISLVLLVFIFRVYRKK